MSVFRRIRWKRLLLTAASVVLTAVVGVVVAVVIILRNPEPLANWALRQQTSPFRIHVDRIIQIGRNRAILHGVEIESRKDESLKVRIEELKLSFDPGQFTEPGLHGIQSLEMREARLAYRPTEGPQISFQADVKVENGKHVATAKDVQVSQGEELHVHIPSVKLELLPGRLLEGALESVTLESPVVAVDLDFFTNDKSKEPDAEPVKWDPGTLIIEDAQISLRGAGLPPVNFRMNLVPEGGLSAVELREVALGEGGALANIDSLRITAPGNVLETRRVESIAIHGAHIRIDPSLPPPTFPAGSSKKDSPPDWFLGEVTIRDSSIAVHDPTGNTPNFQARLNFNAGPLFMKSTESVELELSEIRLATPFAADKSFLGVERMTLVASPAGLATGRVEHILVDGASFSYDRLFRSWMLPSPPSSPPDPMPPAAPDEPAFTWSVGEFEIRNSRVSIEDLGFGIPGIDFAIQTKLSEMSSTALAQGSEKIETVELSDLIIHSPLDPFAPVLNLRSIFIRFSPAGILRNELEEIVVLHPIIFVGEDLFWYADEVRKRTAETEEAPVEEKPLWKLKRFEASYGRLVIATGGASRMALPLNFSTKAENVNFRDINELQLKLNLVVPKEDYVFPSYELELNELFGNIEFGLPPASGANNINNTLYSALTRWRQFLLTELWLTVTYDLQGVNGNFGGGGYGGYLNGGFSFFLQDEVPWIGWFSATGIDMKAFTDVIAPKSFQMEGPADLQVEFNATGPKLDRLTGTYKATAPGKMNITRLEPIIEALPADWTSLKRDISRIGLEVLQNFEYEQGGADFWFLGDQGRLDLDLTGPQGSRKFSVFLHGEKPNPQWQNSSFQSSSR